MHDGRAHDGETATGAIGYEAMLRLVIESLGAESGVALFGRLTSSLGSALDADVCFLARLEDPHNPATMCRTVSVWRRDGEREDVSYPLQGSPSAHVIRAGMLVVASQASALFPDDADFTAMDFHAYAGVAVRDGDGVALGVLAAMSRRPFADVDAAPRLLEVFARRIGVEFARLETEDRLRRANDALRRARDQHAEAERRIRDIAELSSDWFWETDAEGRFIYMSETIAGVSGVMANSYRGLTRRELIGPILAPDSDGVLEHFEALHASRQPYRNISYGMITAEGARRWVSISGRPVHDARGAFVGYRGAGSDITALRAAQGRADRAARRLSEGIDAMTSGFGLFDADQRLIDCNLLFAQMLALPEGFRPTPGTHYADLLRAAARAGAYGPALIDTEAFIAERVARHRAGDGVRSEVALAGGRWVEVSDRMTADGGVVSIRTDITARKHAERRLLDAIANIPVGFLMCDPDDRVLLCNQRYRDLYPELDAHVRPGVGFAELCELCGDLIDADGNALAFDVWLRQRLERHRHPTGPVQTTTQSGRSVMVWESRTSEGGYIGAHVDISALVLLQHELARETRRAEDALEARARFLANMSHELRTPLNAIMGFADMIRMQAAGPLPVRYLEFAERIRQSGGFLLSLIVDILDMSKIEAGQMPISHMAVAPRPAVEEALSMLALQARAKGLSLELVAPPRLPDVWAERRRLVQILQNLVSNAVKFTAAGGVTVRMAIRGATLQVEVEDSGAGMTAEEIKVALTPFQQVRRGDGADYVDGTGLGLPLVKALVELHGGALDIASARGVGTTVRFTLPLAPQPAGA